MLVKHGWKIEVYEKVRLPVKSDWNTIVRFDTLVKRSKFCVKHELRKIKVIFQAII